MNKEFFRGMKEQIEPDEEQVEELKNKLNNTAVVSRKPMWIGGVCAAALCVAVGAGLFLSDSKTDKNSIKTSGSPHSDLDITNEATTGEFTFWAIFEEIGDNTITVTASMPCKMLDSSQWPLET